MKKALRMGELKNLALMEERLKDILEWKNLTITNIYGEKALELKDMVEYLETYGKRLVDFICDTGLYLNNANEEGKKIMFEAQLGALRDIDFGIYPYTTSSNTISAYAPIGAGVPNLKIDKSIGIMKAYSTCVGEGPFTSEYFGEQAEKLRKAGAEYGAATGRPRRVGAFDAVASRYGIRCQGADEIAVTKLDVLTGFDELEITVAYSYKGEQLDEFPFTDILDECKPINIKVKGWKEDISKARKLSDLPENCINYLRKIEELTKCKIKYVSVGAEREEYVVID